MRTHDFWYDLPDSSIAQTPIEPRDNSRLMTLNKNNGSIEHKRFFDIIDLLNPGDVLVLNDSKVLPARLYGNRVRDNFVQSEVDSSKKGAVIEVLLLEQKQSDIWEILVKPGKKARTGQEIEFANGLLKAEIIEVLQNGNRIAKFYYDNNRNFYNILEEIGQMPLPHYITEELKDKNRYQTVYAKELGSSAAPTAGLHFTKELLEKAENKGVNVAYVTLHVGLGTFRPVKVENVTEHKMHSEHYCLTEENADIINRAKLSGGKVVAVGTTSCRTIESIATKNGKIVADEGYTNIFIYPGYEFKILDALITNFHLPESTLIMLVSALAGYDNTMNAYKIAVDDGYRFYSFGDAMFIS